MGIKGILFDKDGTLIDFYEVWGTAVDPVIDKVMELFFLESRSELKLRILKRLGVCGKKIDPEGSLAWKTFDMMAEDILEVLVEYDGSRQYCVEDIRDCLTRGFYEEIAVKREKYPVFTDLPKMIDKLQEMKIRVGIATTDEYESSVICMRKIGIEEKISFYGTAGCGMPAKPDKNLLLGAARQWGIKPEEIAVVGDTPNDMRFAKNAGAIAIGVLSGTGKMEDMKNTADHIIGSIDELIPLINQIKEEGENHWQK